MIALSCSQEQLWLVVWCTSTIPDAIEIVEEKSWQNWKEELR